MTDQEFDMNATYITFLHENSQLNEEASTAKSILGIVLLGPVGWAIYRAARSALDVCNKKCGTFGIGEKRNECYNKCKEDVKKMVMQKKMRAKQAGQKV